jgi:tetratricopeptide (TPR) repeat protein
LNSYANKTIGALVLATALVLAAGAARADSIRETGGIGHDGKITGMGAKGLIIRQSSGPVEVPLSQIRTIVADGFPNLTRAETAYAKGDPAGLAEAEKLYSAMLASSSPTWLRLLAQSRMYKVYLDSGRSSQALDAYLELAQGNAAMVAGLPLPEPVPGNSAANQAMLKKVNDALKTAAGKPYAADLKNLQLALVGMEGKPEDILVVVEPLIKSADAKVRGPALLKKVEALVALKRSAEALGSLAEAEAVLGSEAAPDVAYWRGRILRDTGKNMEAAMEFMKVAILYPAQDKDRTAESLCNAGQALEAANGPKVEVRRLYQEAVDKYAGTAGAERAKRELARLGTS